MKKILMIFFLAIFIYILFLVFKRGWQALPAVLWIKTLYTLIYFASFLSLLTRMFFVNKLPLNVSYIFSAIGFTWLVIVIYMAFYLIVLDGVRIANHYLDFYPSFIKNNYQMVKLTLAVGGLAVIFALLLLGNYRFNNPQIKRVEISLEKFSQGKNIKMVVASDLHLSSYIGRKELRRYVGLINGLDPDIVILAGDVADISLGPLKQGNLSDLLSKIESKYGVYAVSGNHEFYGGERDQIFDYLRSSGITVLMDSTVMAADSSLYIIGRDDRTNLKREPLNNLVKNLDLPIPKILVDHQPFNLDEAKDNGIDLQLSGHTHNGQFWPGNLIVKWVFELPYGYLKKGNTQYYVTSGLGLWGPKFRIGTNSEIVLINLKY